MKHNFIGILNFDIGNVGSVANMLKKIGAQFVLVETEEQLLKCDRLILPGVGAFDTGIMKIRSSALFPKIVSRVVDEQMPILGICLGMQLLFEGSEEGKEKGLGWIPGRVKKFQFSEKSALLKIPHMGWNYIKREGNSAIFGEAVPRERYYFVHSFHVCCDDEYVIARSNYGYDFVCSVKNNNIYGVQFHPEKSHKFGLQLFRNFAEL